MISFKIFFSLYSFEWQLKWPGTNLLFFFGKESVCQGLKLLKLECELKFISP